jgi:cytochrome P450
MENNKAYRKSNAYVRYESAIGLGLITSNGDKWKRDRQKIQPMFRKEQIEGYYFDIVNEVSEKCKQRWLALTENGDMECDITKEMAAITTEVIFKSIFGKDNLDDALVISLHDSFSFIMGYLKGMRLHPRLDLRKVFHTPRYYEFRKALDLIDGTLEKLLQQYQRNPLHDKYNMLALLIEAQKQDPVNFSRQDIRDHCISMVFAGFETTSLLMQWIWYVLDGHPDIAARLRDEMIGCAPVVLNQGSMDISLGSFADMHYLDAALKETMRLYPPFWVTSRQPIEGDKIGDLHADKNTIVLIPQIIMHRHPRWWKNPHAFVPERFLHKSESDIDAGLFFPFSQGPRKCSGYKFAEMEAKLIVSKLLPHFNITILNKMGNAIDPGVSLKLRYPLKAKVSRLH